MAGHASVLGFRRRSAGFTNDVELFSGLEPYSLAGSDAHLGTGARIAAYAGLARAHAEDAKTAQFDALTCCKGLLQPFEHRIHGCLSLSTGQSGALDDMVHNVLFNQSVYLAGSNVLDFTTPYRVDGTAFVRFVNSHIGTRWSPIFLISVRRRFWRAVWGRSGKEFMPGFHQNSTFVPVVLAWRPPVR